MSFFYPDGTQMLTEEREAVTEFTRRMYRVYQKVGGYKVIKELIEQNKKDQRG